jgi:hypothetical protein
MLASACAELFTSWEAHSSRFAPTWGGYAHASPDCPLGGERGTQFNELICARFRFPAKYAWPYVLKHSSLNDDEATARRHRLLTEFVEKTKTDSLQDLVQDAVAHARDH